MESTLTAKESTITAKEHRRSGRKGTAIDTTARQSRGHQAAGASAPLPIPQHVSHEGTKATVAKEAAIARRCANDVHPAL